MLMRADENIRCRGMGISFSDADFPAPFPESLEYSCPARGCWNIAQTGMLIPQSHQIFVCAKGCLRGVVLTAAEMGLLGRYSAVEIREENVLRGDIEKLMTEGVADVLHKLPYRPRAVLIYISCQHFFLGYDQKAVFDALRERFPDIDFLDCYMIPTLRKSGLPPDAVMRRQLYRLLTPGEKKERRLHLAGSDLPLAGTCEMRRWLEGEGWDLVSVHNCRTYEEYLDLAAASRCLVYDPAAARAGRDLEERLGQRCLQVSFVYRAEEIGRNYRALADFLGLDAPDFSEEREKAEEALLSAKKVIGDAPVAVDASFTFRILNFSRMLLEHGFHVAAVYADRFLPEEREDFEWIRKNHPEVLLYPVSAAQMRFREGRHPKTEEFSERTVGSRQQRTADIPEGNLSGNPGESGLEENGGTVLAIGQKAAYFCGTDHFVNIAETGGLYGYDGLVQIAELMEDAFLHEKDRRALIQKKGCGCPSCL